MKKTYYVMWSYFANFSEKPMEVQASSPDEAAREVVRYFSVDFKEKGRVLVFEQPPSYIYTGPNYTGKSIE